MPARFSPTRRKAATSIATVAVILCHAAPNAPAAIHTWTQTAGGAQYWTDGGNWLGGSAPSPASGDTVDFSTVDLLANTALTLGATRTATTWKFGDTSGGQTWTVSGNTLTLAGSGAVIEVGTATSISSVLAVSNGTTATATGNGALTLDSSDFSLGGSATGTSQTLDLSGLNGAFAYNNAAGMFRVAGTFNTGGGQFAWGVLYLAPTSTITASTFGVATANNSGLNPGSLNRTNYVYLEEATTINANTITLGSSKSQGVVQYAVGGGVTDPTLMLRGSDGSSRVTIMDIGVAATNEYTMNNVWDLTSNVTGTSTLDAMIETLTIGNGTRTTTTSGGALVTGSFTMGAGTLDATTMVVGTTNVGSINVTGTFTSGAEGTVKIGTLTIGDKNYTGTSGSRTLNATFNLNGGADLHATTIQRGNNSAQGSATRSFNWNDGTIHNLAGTDLTIGTIAETAPVTWTLASTGSRTFDIENGQTGTVNVVLGGSGGTLAKTGEGTLILNANNTYSGATSVNQGALLVDGAPTGAGDITVADTGRLGGNGSAANAAVIIETGGGLSLDISDWTGIAGTGYSDLTVKSLNLPAGAWAIDVGSATTYTNFSEAPATFSFLITSLGIDGFNADNYTVTAGDAFPGTGTWSVQVVGNTLELAYSPGAGSDYSNWAAGYEEYDLSDPQADLDGDGMTNWQEYAFGLNPTSGASVNPILSIADLKTLGQFTYTRRYNSGLTYSVYTSTDLKTWEWINPLLFSEEAESPVAGVQTVLIELTGFEPPDTFFLRVAAD